MLDLFHTMLSTLISKMPAPLLLIISSIPDPRALLRLPLFLDLRLLARRLPSLPKDHHSIRSCPRRRGCEDTTRLRMPLQLSRNRSNGSPHLRLPRITTLRHPLLVPIPWHRRHPLMPLTPYLRPPVVRRPSVRQNNSCLRSTRRNCFAGSTSSRMRPQMAPLVRHQRRHLGRRTLSTVPAVVAVHRLPRLLPTLCPELRLPPAP